MNEDRPPPDARARMLYNVNPWYEHQKLQERVAGAIERIEGRGPLPLLRHFTVTRTGGDMRIGCWCGKARLIETSYPNQFTRLLNEWLWDHELCEPKKDV